MVSKEDAHRRSAEAVKQIRRAREMIADTRSLVASSTEAIQHSKAGLRRARLLDTTVSGPAPLARRPLHVAEPVFEVVSQQEFESSTVSVDGKRFVDCVFHNCVIQYSGFPVIFESTRFDGCRFRFEDQAASVMMFMECFGLVADDAPGFDLGQVPSHLKSRPN